MTNPCPVCKTELRKTESQGDRYFFDCPRCGPFSLSGTAQSMMKGRLEQVKDGSAKLSHALYRMTKRQQWAMLTSELLDNILFNTELPRPQEQFENLILWLGDSQPSMGRAMHVPNEAIAAVGVVDSAGLGYMVGQAIDAGLVSGSVQKMMSGDCIIPSAQLTLNGWKWFEDLKRGKSSSRIAFMAMQFGDAELDGIYNDHFKAAVAATGFDLKRVDEGQPAGLIDDQLRVDIRQSRFLIADLTHQNRGAYWEAGFAEGLGKPVIYTCRKDIFNDKSQGTHFDTNHHLTVVWDLENIDGAVAKLKATIRATLPDEARMDD